MLNIQRSMLKALLTPSASSPASASLELEAAPLVSIVINNCNYGRFLAGAIDSVLNQTLMIDPKVQVEIIVVDDGSTDYSRAVIRQYSSKVIAILKENGGQDSAFNAGFMSARGKIVCFLDADDRFMPDKLEQVVRCFNQHPDIGWCFHSLQLKDIHTGHTICMTKAFPGNEHDTSRPCDFREPLRLGRLPFYPASTSGLCFRRSLLQLILPMPETFMPTSADRYVRLAAMGIAPGYFLANELTVQGIHGNNASTMRRDRPALPERQIVIAYLLRTQFPQLARYANRLFSRGLTAYKAIPTGAVNPEYKTVIHHYWQMCSPLESGLIWLIRLYRQRPWRRRKIREVDFYYFAQPTAPEVSTKKTVSEKVSALR